MLPTSNIFHLAAVVVALVAVWMLVDYFVKDETVKFVLKVLGGAFLIIIAIGVLARMVGW